MLADQGGDSNLWLPWRGAKAGSVSAVCVMSILAVLSATNYARAVTDLPTGSAKGSLAYDGATAELKFAATFVDRKDERRPIVLVISDQKLPVEKWESELDMTMDHSHWTGVVFFFGKEGQMFRCAVHMNGRQSIGKTRGVLV